MADDDTRHVDLADLASYVKHHINYHASMTGDGLPGIINLDKEVPFFAASDSNRIIGHMSLRYALYRFMKLEDGHSIFAELHQESPLASVDAVIPNTPEAETMVLMMKRNIGAFLTANEKPRHIAGIFDVTRIYRLICRQYVTISPIFIGLPYFTD